VYDAVVPYPIGSSTLSRYVLTATRYGYDGVISLTRYDGTDRDHERSRPAVDPGAITGDVVDGALIDATDRERASVALDRSREAHTIVVCRAETTSLQRFGAESHRVDVLSVPVQGEALEHGILKAAAANEVRVAVDLDPVLHDCGGDRVRAIATLQRRKRFLDDVGANHVVTASPTDHLELRAPRDLAAVGASVDLGEEWTRDGLAEWGELVERNRDRRSEAFVEPGVYRGRPDDRETPEYRADDHAGDGRQGVDSP
jgi:ribonuclease P/MRP protein subunit RPP1